MYSVKYEVSTCVAVFAIKGLVDLLATQGTLVIPVSQTEIFILLKILQP